MIGMGEPLRVLFVEDSADDAELEARQLRAAGFDVSYERVASAEGLRAALHRPLELIIADYSMPGFTGIDALAIWREQRPEIPFLLVSGTVGEDRAVTALKAGAHDYLLKDNLGRLGPAVVRVLRESAAARERERGARSEAFLARASAVLAESLDYATTLKRVAALAVPEVADWCLVDVVDDRGILRPVALAHSEPEKESAAESLRRHYPSDPDAPRGPARVAQTGEPQLVADITDEQLVSWARDPAHLDLLRSLAPHSYVCVPLRARGATFGTLTLVSSRSGRRYDALDLSFAVELGHRAAVAVDNARLYARAQEAVALRDDFLSVAAHELRTPLTTLQLQLQSLVAAVGKRETATADARDLVKLKRAARSTERLTGLVDTLVDVSRIASGHLVLNRQRLDLDPLVREVADRNREEARNAGCELVVETVSDAFTWCDRERIDQALGNLLSNAIKYGVGRPIEVRLTVNHAHVQLSVRDQGMGIAAVDIERIFGRFERAVSVRHYGGLGLGLYVTREIVLAHQGSIEAHSEPGAGATFTIRLPLEPA
jgi:signal transduction histidine kinase/FixJ family two-component response regulator